MILLAMFWRLRARAGRQFSVAFTRRGSLASISRGVRRRRDIYLESSWKMASSLSRRPEASASKLDRDRTEWFLGTMAREVSFCSGR